MTDNSPVTVAVSKVVWNQIGMDPGEGVRTPDLLEDTRVLLQKRDGGGRRERGRRKGERKEEGGWKRERERSMNGKGKERETVEEEGRSLAPRPVLLHIRHHY